jgi:hypothetical protein
MASILGKPGSPGQFPTHDLSTVRGALQWWVKFGSRLTVGLQSHDRRMTDAVAARDVSRPEVPLMLLALADEVID